MQQPTCTNVRIRSTQDAHRIFFAIQKRRLFMVTRRLDVDERHALRSGCIYAWEERGPHTEITGLGIERFTEGRRWSPSRVRDEFLFYYEKYSPPQDATQPSPVEKQPPRDWDPLVKQTYSVWVDTDKGRRKWHLTAYFTQTTVDQMGTVDDISGVGDLEVPEGLFQSTRVSKNRKSDDSQGRSSVEISKPLTASTVTRTYAPFPSTHSPPRVNQSAAPSPSQCSQIYQPYHSTDYTHVSPYDHPKTLPSPAQQPHTSLPPIRDPYHEPHGQSPHEITGYGYGRHGVCGHRSSIEYAEPREEDAPYHSDMGSRMAEDTNYGAQASYSPQGSPLTHASNPFSNQATSFYRPVTHPASETNDEMLPSHSHHVWYPMQSERNTIEIPTSFPLRPSYPTGPQVSPTYSYSHPDPYHSDPSVAATTHSTSSESHIQSFTRAHAYTYSRTPSRSPSPSSLASPTYPSHSPDSLPGSSPSSQHSCSYDAGRRSSLGPSRVDLAPLHALQRNHPYRRDPVDDRALRLLGPRSS